MFDFISGKLHKATSDSITLEVSGIGYKLLIPANCFVQLPPVGTHIIIYTSFVIREFSQTLYGFLYETDRNLFDRLLSVTGVGPKLALSVIGHLSSEQLRDALVRRDVQILCKVPGIGKKTAERLLVELKDTLPDIIDLSQASAEPRLGFVQDAVSALLNLGYNQFTAQKAVKKTIETQNVSDLATLITASLKNV